jgi:hypothetical protein
MSMTVSSPAGWVRWATWAVCFATSSWLGIPKGVVRVVDVVLGGMT